MFGVMGFFPTYLQMASDYDATDAGLLIISLVVGLARCSWRLTAGHRLVMCPPPPPAISVSGCSAPVTPA